MSGAADYSTNKSLAAAAAEVEVVPENYFVPLDFAQIFPQPAPLEIDIGCGDGAFLVARAEQIPERNFLGLERLEGRVRTACKKSARAHLPNVRFLRIDSIYACRHLFPAHSVAMAHLLFPDPWPKSKHRRRRIVTPEFLASVRDLLPSGGRLRVVTDQEKYFAKIRELIPAHDFSEEENVAEDFPPTTFENHYIAAGLPVYRLVLRKV